MRRSRRDARRVREAPLEGAGGPTRRCGRPYSTGCPQVGAIRDWRLTDGRSSGVPWRCSNTCSNIPSAEMTSTPISAGGLRRSPDRSPVRHRWRRGRAGRGGGATRSYFNTGRRDMRRYDDPVEVRKGMVGGPGGRVEGPEQFLWRGRLWKVRDVLAHWVETGPWWQSSGVQAVLGADRLDLPELPEPGDPADPADPGERGGVLALRQALLAEREVWRVEAGRGQAGQPPR